LTPDGKIGGLPNKAGQVSPEFWRIGESVEQGEENLLGLIAREQERR